MLETDPPHRPSRFLRRLLIVCLVALVLRVVAGGFVNVDGETGGMRGFQCYREMAENLAAGTGCHWTFYLGFGEKWANQPPGYPALVAAVLLTGTWPFGLVVLQSLVGALAVLVAGLFARRLAGDRAGLIAAALAALYPYYLVLDTALLEHVLMTLAVALTGHLFLRTVDAGKIRHAALIGLVAGLGTLVRPTLVPSLPFLALAFLLALGWRRGALAAGAALLVFGATVAPWLVRNAEVVGRPVLSSATGRTLWIGNNDLTREVYPARSIDLVEARAFRALPAETRRRVRELADDEIAQSEVFGEIAREWIREHPGRFVRGVFVKLGALFSPLLNPPTEPPEWKNLVYTLTYTPLLLLGLAGFFLLRREWRRWLAVPALFLGFMATAALFWGESRHRAPLDVLLMVGAAAFLARLLPGGRSRDEPA